MSCIENRNIIGWILAVAITLILHTNVAIAATPAIPDSLLSQTSPQQLHTLSGALQKKEAAQSSQSVDRLYTQTIPEDEQKTTSKKNALSPIEQSYADRIKLSVTKSEPRISPSVTLNSLIAGPTQTPINPSRSILAGSSADVTPNSEAPFPLLQFGYSLFSKPATAIGGRIIPSDSGFILGADDQFSIQLWGSIEEKIDAQIDGNGNVVLPKIGQIKLGGMSVGTARSVLINAYSQFYVNFELAITVNKARPITAYIVGNAIRPGAYAIDRNTTLFDLLLASGGPSKDGSLRNIQLVRNGTAIGQIDLYSFLIEGKSLRDFTLKDQDKIVISKIGQTILVKGNVVRPGIYELRAGDTLVQATSFSAGALPFTSPDRIQITRSAGGLFQKIVDAKASVSNGQLNPESLPLQNGDIIEFFPMANDVRGYVEVTGNIKNPGRYAYTSGLTLKSLVESAGGLLPDTDKSKVQITRSISKTKNQLFHVDYLQPGFLLSDRDSILFYSNQDFEGTPQVEIEGAVMTPGQYVLNRDMRISDLILLAKLDPAQSVESAELYRQNKTEYPTLLRLNLSAILSNTKSTENILLQRGDHLFIRSSNLVSTQKIVRLQGEFVYPGAYPIRDGETISSVIERAGGFTNSAFLSGAILTRKSAQKGELLGQQRILKDERKQLAQDQSLLNQQGIDKSAAEEILLSRRKENLDQLESELSSFTGRVVTQMDPYSEFKSSIYDVPMENGDVLTIPVYPSTIQLIGGVQNPASIIYTPGKSFDYYISQVGGYTEYAHKDGIYVIKANGSTSKDLSQIDVGDIIFVPERVKLPFDWIKLITSITDVVFKTVFLKKELFP